MVAVPDNNGRGEKRRPHTDAVHPDARGGIASRPVVHSPLSRSCSCSIVVVDDCSEYDVSSYSPIDHNLSMNGEDDVDHDHDDVVAALQSKTPHLRKGIEEAEEIRRIRRTPDGSRTS